MPLVALEICPGCKQVNRVYVLARDIAETDDLSTHYVCPACQITLTLRSQIYQPVDVQPEDSVMSVSVRSRKSDGSTYSEPSASHEADASH